LKTHGKFAALRCDALSLVCGPSGYQTRSWKRKKGVRSNSARNDVRYVPGDQQSDTGILADHSLQGLMATGIMPNHLGRGAVFLFDRLLIAARPQPDCANNNIAIVTKKI
jgi:hypothetical protein